MSCSTDMNMRPPIRQNAPQPQIDQQAQNGSIKASNINVDEEERKYIKEHIYNYTKERLPQVRSLEAICKRSEEYHLQRATSKEMYMNTTVAENVAKAMIATVVKSFKENRSNAATRQAASGPAATGMTMMPTPNYVPQQTTANPNFVPNIHMNAPQAMGGNGYYTDTSHMNNRAFIGNGHNHYENNAMYPLPRERLQRMNGNESNQASQMIPVPGLPPQMIQQLKSQNLVGMKRPAPDTNQNRRKPDYVEVGFLLFHSFRCAGDMGCETKCHQAKTALRHLRDCQDPACTKCIPLKKYYYHLQQCPPEGCETCATFVQGAKKYGPKSANSAENLRSGKRPKLEQPDARTGGTVQKMAVSPQPQTSPLGKGRTSQMVQVNVKLKEGGALGKSDVVVKQEVVTGQASSSKKQQIVGVSLLDLFTPENIEEHIANMRQWNGQSKIKAEKSTVRDTKVTNRCTACEYGTLSYEPPPLYCTYCGVRIKKDVHYWSGTTPVKQEAFHCCLKCYGTVPGIDPDGMTKRCNSGVIPDIEAWVQCNRCNAWDHQVCGLYNTKSELSVHADYICLKCVQADVRRNLRQPVPPSTVLGAKDLPRTLLSDHLEQRLARSLKQERAERARAQGKRIDEVPAAEGLVVRVVSSVDKILDVRPRLAELFKGADYPSSYPYKSKALLLFQNIGGVDVILFGLYVQEFGSECPAPNNRRLYIAYLDSVKYFQPEVKTEHGEALRTFVYHQILIGYLEYSKRRGFGSCYIWACPPLRGEDYILYCHPENQKTPRSDKLREWYLEMIRKAMRENIVVNYSNFYEFFFEMTAGCKATITAKNVPLFGGDYWHDAAHDTLARLEQDEEDKRKGQRKKGVARRTCEPEMTKDQQLMKKLGHTIYPLKDDFIMVHLHHWCRHCRQYILSGFRWVCQQCQDFELCNGCYLEDQKLSEKARHPYYLDVQKLSEKSRHQWKPLHQFCGVEVTDVPADTKDRDEIIECDFFDTRQSFLSLCQGNHYQHETLRRAKHSSMMVLFHLHNPSAPAFVSSCNRCSIEIEAGRGWRCGTCADYDLCGQCYPKEMHPHKMSPHQSTKKLAPKNQKDMLELLVHASACSEDKGCTYPKCRNVKQLFRHGNLCKTRMALGCKHCKHMWLLLSLHAKTCKQAVCVVPRCKDLKVHLRLVKLQDESRPRADVAERIQQRMSDLNLASGAGSSV